MADAALPFSPDQLTANSRGLAMRLLVGLGMLMVVSALAGCVTDKGDVTGSIAAPGGSGSSADMRAYASRWGDRYRADPANKEAALNYARGLRALTQYAQAEAVLESAAIKTPYDPDILGAYGKALSDAGKFKTASEVLSRAQNPENPNWSILSAQGSVADQMGDHAQAQEFYAAALKIRPGDSSVLSNLGLSYALSNQLLRAEDTMRQAASSPGADMRVRQNLALVMALEGKFGEAEQISQQDLSPADAAANVASIKTMIARSSTLSAIQHGRPAARPPRSPQRLQAALQAN